MKIVGNAAAGQWIKATNAAEKVMAKALTVSTRQLGKAAVQKGREAITAAGFSSKFARTLVALNKPPTGYVLNPSVYIHSTINYADVFETGKTIHRKGEHYLWLPLPTAPAGKDRPHLTVAQYLAQEGPLVLVRRPGKPPLLSAPIKGAVKPRQARPFTRKRLKKGREAPREEVRLVPMYIGKTEITIPKKFDVEAAADRVLEQFQEAYDANVAPDEEIE